MADTIVTARIKLRNDTAAYWLAANPVLLAGEMGLENDTGKYKFGNGTVAWNALPYVACISDAEKTRWNEAAAAIGDIGAALDAINGEVIG